tara:strand:- start:44 stop:256 length:213 start_codon:yes stop_codon:yes gene_type:complete
MADKELKKKVESFKNTTLFYVLKYITRDCDINALNHLKQIINAQIKTLKVAELMRVKKDVYAMQKEMVGK